VKNKLPGEFQLINLLSRSLRQAGEPGVIGVGDDCAALPLGEQMQLLTCDAAVAGRHFTPGLTPWETVGWRLGSANASDIAACGGTPEWALVSLALGDEIEPGELEALYRGLEEAGAEYGYRIIGGNVSGAEQHQINVFLLGRTARFVARGGARPGDLVAVSGDLGGAEAGRRIFEDSTGNPPDSPVERPLLERYLRPRARTDLAGLLRETASAAIDISDGLAAELGHLAGASGVRMEIESALIPLAPGLREWAALRGADPLRLALGSGEEYQLLLTAPAEHQRLLTEAGISIIGRVEEPSAAPPERGEPVAESGEVLLDGRPLPPLGWNHLGWNHLGWNHLG